jgi:hypothetical protein
VARFYFLNLITYFATIASLTLAVLLLGWRLGRRYHGSATDMSHRTALLLIGAGSLWFVAAYFTRNYADTDGWGASGAEWFAHSGRWLLLLAAMLVGHGWIVGAGHTPSGSGRRIFYYVAVFGIAALVISRTLPIYFLLENGRRDANGILRQSERVEATCGAVALLNFLERYAHHEPLTEREVSRVCGVTAEGSTTTALVKAARHFGQTNATAQVLTMAELDQAHLPAIVSIATLPMMRHATLLIQLDGERARFIDPAYGFWEVSRARFADIWYGKTVLLD